MVHIASDYRGLDTRFTSARRWRRIAKHELSSVIAKNRMPDLECPTVVIGCTKPLQVPDIGQELQNTNRLLML